MAKRQDSGSDAAHQNQRPEPYGEDAMPEMDDRVRGRAEEADAEEFEETEDLDDDDVDDEEEGSY